MPTSDPDSNGLAQWTPSVPGYQILAQRRSTSTTTEWDAMQLSLERTVSMLTPCAERLSDPSWCARFEELSCAFARLHHRNFLQVIDTARTADGVPYTIVERLEGQSLAALLRNEGRIAPERAARIVLQLADALDNAWKQSGFVLRNLKPENLVVLSGDVVKITAFLYAAIVRPGSDPLAADGGELVGTPHYMPPEQIDALRTIDFHADMYAVGAIFYHMLSGHAPFGETDDPMEVLRLQKEKMVPAPSDENPAIPAGFSHVLLRMMAKRPADRYPYWQDVSEDIERVLSGRAPYLPSAGGAPWVPPPSTVAPATPVPAGRRRVSVGGRSPAPGIGRKGKVIAVGRAAAPSPSPRISRPVEVSPAPSSKPVLSFRKSSASPVSEPSPASNSVPEAPPPVPVLRFGGSSSAPVPEAPQPAPVLRFGGSTASAVPEESDTRRNAPASADAAPVAVAPSLSPSAGDSGLAPTSEAPSGYEQAKPVAYSDAFSRAPVPVPERVDDEPEAPVVPKPAGIRSPPFLLRVAGLAAVLVLFFVVARMRIGSLDGGGNAGAPPTPKPASASSFETDVGMPSISGADSDSSAVTDAVGFLGGYEEGNPFAPGADDGDAPAYASDESWYEPSETVVSSAAPPSPVRSLSGVMPSSGVQAADSAESELAPNPNFGGQVTSAGSAEDASTEPEVKRPLSRFEDVVLDLYETLRSKPFSESIRHAKITLKAASEQTPEDAARYQALFVPFREAISWEDLIGLSLASSPAERTVVLAGTPFRIVPRRYANGQLVCDRVGDENTRTLRDQRLDLTKMDTKDMYSILQDMPVDERTHGALESRALLTLREGAPDDFRRLVKRYPARLSALEPFLQAHSMER